MVAESAQCHLRTQTIVYVTNKIIVCVRQTVDMLHGNFVFLSFPECEIDTSNAEVSDGDGSVRKVKLERENYTAAVDIPTYFLKLPLICLVGISPSKQTQSFYS